jgi:Zn-dependent M28 family amino/carboxypeptidase
MLFALILAASLSFTEQHAASAYSYARDLADNHSPRDAGTVPGKIAANWILDTASSAGLDVRRDPFVAETPRGRRSMMNLTAEFKIRNDAEWIVIVSHYDTKSGTGCPGANDGASTSGLLIALGEMLQVWKGDAPPSSNIMFIWTDGEECMQAYGPNDGFWGSRHAAQIMRRKGLKVKAVIVLDMLGDENLGITIPQNSDEALAKLAVEAGEKCGVKVRRLDGKVKDDHMAFAEAGYPAIDLIDFDYPHWHTPEDTMKHVSERSLEQSGRLVAAMLDELMK